MTLKHKKNASKKKKDIHTTVIVTVYSLDDVARHENPSHLYIHDTTESPPGSNGSLESPGRAEHHTVWSLKVKRDLELRHRRMWWEGGVGGEVKSV